MFYHWILWQDEIHGKIDRNYDHETLNENTYLLCYDAHMELYGNHETCDIPY